MEPQDKLYVVCNILVGDDGVNPVTLNDYADVFEVMYGGEWIAIPAGETMVLPKYKADHYAKHLIDYLLIKEGRMIHDKALRDPLFERIVLHESAETEEVGSSFTDRSDFGEDTKDISTGSEPDGVEITGDGEVGSDTGSGSTESDIEEGSSERGDIEAVESEKPIVKRGSKPGAAKRVTKQ